MLPGDILIQDCANAAELDQAFHTAYQFKQRHVREDLSISRSAKTCTVVVRRNVNGSLS